MRNKTKGFFTLPGEAGYEDLTLELAQKWGADVIRDSDGTALSEKILSSDYDIYSTLCLVRSDNSWAKANRDKLQQNFLMSDPVVATENVLIIDLLKGYFREQFEVNFNDDPKKWWQVFDRTTGQEISEENWEFDKEAGTVTIINTTKWHKYTVNFLAYRIWEAISMYNHITNNWGDREHLMPIDPIYPETQDFMLSYLDKWLQDHPHTNVVRFTSMFYNFCWLWGDDPNLKHRYSDWASYDFSVSPYAITQFEKETGIKITSEDFINNGLLNNTHNVPSEKIRAWMDYVNKFVTTFGGELVDLVHKYGKKAYVFYDDHWVGIEPYSPRFKDFNFDGIIKCVFNAFEARKCAGVKGVATHELRLHPYLFPTGLSGEPTFKAGGNPTKDAKDFWMKIRRALLRAPVQRIGLGGYLHLVEDFPDFVDYIEELANEFRMLRGLHDNDKPYTVPGKVAVLTCWGNLRSWICSGHMHEHPEVALNHVNEALAGLPLDVEYISFDGIRANGIPEDVKVIINCGILDSAWSGGDNWKDPSVVSAITEWVAQGGGFIGIEEPSATIYSSQYFQLSHILGVDRETGRTLSKNKYNYQPCTSHFIMEDTTETLDFGTDIDNIYVIDGKTDVLAHECGSIRVAAREFVNGRGVYASGFKFSPENTRMLFRAILWASGAEKELDCWTTDNVKTECAYFPASNKLVVINNGSDSETTIVKNSKGESINITLKPYAIEIIDA